MKCLKWNGAGREYAHIQKLFDFGFNILEIVDQNIQRRHERDCEVAEVSAQFLREATNR
jgi:hypothetical protein